MNVMHAMSLLTNSQLALQGAYFVTGTDTEIGKTTTTAQLVKALANQGRRVYAIKPVTAGLETAADGTQYSDDARRINESANVKPPVTAIAPIQLSTPCSPHIAATIDQVTLAAADITQVVQHTLGAYPADVVLVEGAGGWFTPINDTQTLADVAQALDSPVVVVVGVKLGSLNHAMLTLQAIWQAKLNVALVVFNQLAADTAFFAEQVAWLSDYIARQAPQHQTSCPQLVWQDFLH